MMNSKQFLEEGQAIVRQYLVENWPDPECGVKTVAEIVWRTFNNDREAAAPVYKELTGFNMSPTGYKFLLRHLKKIAKGE